MGCTRTRKENFPCALIKSLLLRDHAGIYTRDSSRFLLSWKEKKKKIEKGKKKKEREKSFSRCLDCWLEQKRKDKNLWRVPTKKRMEKLISFSLSTCLFYPLHSILFSFQSLKGLKCLFYFFTFMINKGIGKWFRSLSTSGYSNVWGAIKIRKKIEEITVSRSVRITGSVKDSTDYSDFIVPCRSL